MTKIVEEVLDRYYSPDNQERLTPSAFMALVTLARECAGKFGFSQVSVRRIRRLTKLGSTNTVQRALRELIEKGYILRLNSSAKTFSTSLYMLVPEKEEPKGKSNIPSSLDAQYTGQKLMKEIDELMGEIH